VAIFSAAVQEVGPETTLRPVADPVTSQNQPRSPHQTGPSMPLKGIRNLPHSMPFWGGWTSLPLKRAFKKLGRSQLRKLARVATSLEAATTTTVTTTAPTTNTTTPRATRKMEERLGRSSTSVVRCLYSAGWGVTNTGTRMPSRSGDTETPIFGIVTAFCAQTKRQLFLAWGISRVATR